MAKLFSDCIKCLGPYIGFSGLISSKKVQMDPLTPLVPFAFHPRDTQMRMMVARMFAAFRVAIDQLKAYYEGISDVSDPRGKNCKVNTLMSTVIMMVTPITNLFISSICLKSQIG